MDSGLKEGEQQGGEAGTTQGRTDAIARFKAVMNTGADPVATVRECSGGVNTYCYTVPGYDPGVGDYYTKYVGPVPDERTIIRKELRPEQLPVYSTWDSQYLGEMQPVTSSELGSEKGDRGFAKDKWYDPGFAFQTWLDRPIDTHARYQALSTELHVNPKDPSSPLKMDPKKNRPWNPKGVFEDVFREAYAKYIDYYFPKEFGRELDEGQALGEVVGERLGRRVAQYKGMRQAFNSKFRDSAQASYKDAWHSAYTSTFGETFSYYNTHEILSLEFKGIIGETTDGIIQAGERIKAEFTVTNEGGRGVELKTTMTCVDPADPSKSCIRDVIPQSFNIARLTATTFTTDYIAQMEQSLKPRQTAPLTLHVNNEMRTMNQLIQKMIEITGEPKIRLDVSEGKGTVTVRVTNVSTIGTPGTPGALTAFLLLNDREAYMQEVNPLAGSSGANVVFTFKDVDPLALIEGSINASIVVRMNNGVMDEKGQIQLQAENPNEELAKYFNQLVNGRGQFNSEDRIAEVATRIQKINFEETKRLRKAKGNPWENNSTETMLGMLVSLNQASEQTPAAQKRYDALAHQLWEARKNLPKFLIWKSGKRKAYEKMVKLLAKTKI
jgi:hypothetical protein